MNKDISKGFSIGIVMPIIILVIYIKFILEKELDSALSAFEVTNTLSHHISLSVFLTNLALFFFFLRRKREEVSRGVLGATFIYTFIVIYIKFF